jgi:hypothetical protein
MEKTLSHFKKTLLETERRVEKKKKSAMNSHDIWDQTVYYAIGALHSKDAYN